MIQIIKFALLYWGGPFARFNAWPGGYVTWGDSVHLTEVLGLIVLLTSFGFAAVRFFRPGWGGQVAVFGFVLLTIVILTGLAAASSRAQFGILEATNKKYASFAALGWLGVFAVVVGIVGSDANVRRWRNALVSLVALAIFVSFTIAGAEREMRLWQRCRENNWQAALAAFLEVNDRDPLGDLSPDGASVAEYIKDIYPRGVGIFSYFSFRWGDDAKAFLAEKQETACRGEVETLDPIPAANLTNVFDAPGMAGKVSGWTWMDEDHAPAKTVIAVDARDRIVGVARTIRMSLRAELWLGQIFKRNLGWVGYVRLTEPPPVRFYALSSDDKSYCVLGGVGNVR